MGEKAEKADRRAGTAAKSLSLTYAQLEFLSKKDNSSAWVRRAIDLAAGVEGGSLAVVRVDGGLWSRLAARAIEEQKAGGTKLWSELFELTLGAIGAYEAARAADGRDLSEDPAYVEFYRSGRKIAEELRRLAGALRGPPGHT